MRRFTTESRTDANLREMLQKAMHELEENAHLNLETLGNFEHMTSNISKWCICQTLCWEPLDVVFLNQNQLEISPKIPLDPVSSKNNVVFKTAVKWMPKNYKNKDRNPNDPDISISTQHTDRKGFSYYLKKISQQIFQYSKSTKT